ncbi:MAG: hypothetical protein NWF09_07730 [Candidatus Bathyarchaeota archaeon]|nr:hypothetical protein [Candidatus Bathyarchaeota archaeon]
MVTVNELRDLLNIVVGCNLQYNGFPCNTCFHTVLASEAEKVENPPNIDRIHEWWEATLIFRGDYKNGDLIYIPKKELKKRINELASFLKEVSAPKQQY